jgi:hypothetical protein
MKRTATAAEIATAVGISRQAVVKKLSGNIRYKWAKGQSGSEKHYFHIFLPEAWRIALSAKAAVPETETLAGADAQLGADAARQIITARAEEKERQQIAQEEGIAAFEQLSEQRKKEAQARFSLLQICDAFVNAARYDIKRYARRSKTGDKAFVAAYNSGKIAVSDDIKAIIGEQTSYSTIRRISDAYYRGGIAGLAFQYHNPKRGSTELSEQQQEEVIKVMCRNPATSCLNIQRGLQGRFGMEVPSSSIINRFRMRWIAENEELWMFYTNPDEWKSKRMFAFGSASAHVERLNQLWEADSTPADVMLTDGRHSIIGIIDVYSRRLKLFVSKTSRAVSVVALVRHCLIDWGVPEVIKTDNGKDYVSDHVVRVLHGMMIEQKLCTPFQGWEKPHIERTFKTFLHGLVELMPNYIGHNVTERKTIEARRSFAERVMHKESEPVAVNMSARELQKFCNEWTNFIYQHDAHEGLGGKAPIDMVRSWREPIRRISEPRALDMLLLPAPDNSGIRTITKKGIRVENRLYQSPEFSGHVGESVYVLLDPADMGTVFVYTVNERDERAFLCPAIDPEWVGIDLAGFATKAKKHQDKYMREKKRELTQLGKQEGSREAYQDYMDLRRGQVENIIEFPAAGIAYSTPMLAEAGKAVAAIDELKSEDKGREAMVLDLGDAELAKVQTPVKEEKIFVLRTDADEYIDLRTRVRTEKRKLTKSEYEWLGWFYNESNSGKSYKALEGDLRVKVGLAETLQAEA